MEGLYVKNYLMSHTSLPSESPFFASQINHVQKHYVYCLPPPALRPPHTFCKALAEIWTLLLPKESSSSYSYPSPMCPRTSSSSSSLSQARLLTK